MNQMLTIFIMFSPHVNSQISLLCCFVVTLRAGISQTFVFEFYVVFKVTLLCCLVIALATGILHTCVFRLHVSVQVETVTEDGVTLLTTVSASLNNLTFMFGLFVSGQMMAVTKFCLAFVT